MTRGEFEPTEPDVQPEDRPANRPDDRDDSRSSDRDDEPTNGTNGQGDREIELERPAAIDRSKAVPESVKSNGTDGVSNVRDGSDADPVVEARGVNVSLGGVQILEDVDVSVDGGTLVGLVGPNGAGKSTLLRAMRALLPIDSGEVRIADVPVHDCSARDVGQTVASVPQTTTLSFSFTVQQTVEMGRTPHVSRFGTLGDDDRRAIREAMERTEVRQFADRSITEVSGGERQRVLLARALAQETPVLFLDEPTASLDVNHAVQTLEMVDDLVAEGKTVVAAIHDLDLAARYCDELVLLSDGRVQASGTPAEVLTSESLREAFDATAIVAGQPAADAPGVTALAQPDGGAIDGETRVHVLGCGRQAALAVARLSATEATVTVGPVHEGDDAAVLADDVGIEAVTVSPFSALSESVAQRVRRRIAAADCLLRTGDVSPPVEALLGRMDGSVPPVVDADALAPAEIPTAIAERLGAGAEP